MATQFIDRLLQLELFGSPQIHYRGQLLNSFVSAKVRALLIYLAVTARPHSRDHLAHLLWEDTPATMKVNLRKALSNLRHLIGEVLVEDAKESISLDPGQVWVDVIEFGRLIQSDSTQEAAKLYQADFLNGFNVSLSYEFETWALSEQSRLKTQMVDLLRHQASQLEKQGALGQALQAVRRLLEVEPWHEEVHRWLMRLLTENGQRSAALAHFEVCKRILQEELAVEPSEETHVLFRKIQTGELFADQDQRDETQTDGERRMPADDDLERRRSPATITLRQGLPDFLQSVLPTPVQASMFVGREVELAHLDQQLEQVLGGQGLVSFVAGEAGSGKTVLLREFTKRAMRKDASLVVASGSCSAYGGLGDPYLPFREIMALLTGDVEARWRAGLITWDHACRLWNLIPSIAQALLQQGSNLFETFLSSAAFYTRASLAVTNDPAWLQQLASLTTPNQPKQDQGGIDQSALFEMYTRVLQRIAQQHPLILVVEDLHWTDSGSLSLLFHLGRRLAGQRIWVIGTYRPHALTTNRNTLHAGDAERHPLEAIVHEFQRLFGEAPLDLGKSDGQQFVQSILNHEKNRLPESFRMNLFHHTQGHALFTTEILRGMQQRHDLVRDETGHWVIGKAIDWSQLPSRVEGVIEERIARLPAPLLAMVKVASVMGEAFTAEVVARVLQLDERNIVQQMSELTERHHDLIRSGGTHRLGTQHLSQYRFRHILFQHYIYQTLSDAELTYLHEDIGNTLEQFYQEQTDTIAVQLAHHFRAAGLTSKAVVYLQKAGQQADARFAHREATNFYQDALALNATLTGKETHVKQSIVLQMALAEAQFKSGQIDPALRAYRSAADLARARGLTEHLAQAALGYEQVRYRFNLPAQPSIHLLQGALAQIGEVESILRVRVLGQLAQALFFDGKAEQARTLSLRAIEMARRVNDPTTLFDVLYAFTLANRAPDDIQGRLANLDELLHLAQTLNDRVRETHVYAALTVDHLSFGNIDKVDELLKIQASLSDELQHMFFLFISPVFLSMRATLAGNFALGEQFAEQALLVDQQMQVKNTDGIYGILMFTIRREQGEFQQLLPILQDFVDHNPESAVWLPGLALIYVDLNLVKEARTQFELLAANAFAALPQDGLFAGTLAYLSEVCAFLQDEMRAAYLYQQLLPYAALVIVLGFGVACLGAAAHYLGLLATTMQQWDDAERHFETALQLNRQIKSPLRLAHTQVQYAIMLLRRNQSGDHTRAITLLNQALDAIEALDLKALAGKVEMIRQQYFASKANT